MSQVGPIYQTPTDWREFGGVALPDRLLVVDLLMSAMMITMMVMMVMVMMMALVLKVVIRNCFLADPRAEKMLKNICYGMNL